MQTRPSRGLCPNVFSPSEWKCVKGSFSFASRGPDHEFAMLFFLFHTPNTTPLARLKESAWAFLLSNCIRLRPPSPFNSKVEQLVAFIFNPGDITFHRIPLGPPNPLWSISFVLMRLLLREARRYCNIQSWNYHLALVSHCIICPEEINRKRLAPWHLIPFPLKKILQSKSFYYHFKVIWPCVLLRA